MVKLIIPLNDINRVYICDSDSLYNVNKLNINANINENMNGYMKIILIKTNPDYNANIIGNDKMINILHK